MCSELWMFWRLSPLSPRLLNVLETLSAFSTSLWNCGWPKLGARNHFRCISPLLRRWNRVSLTSHAPANVTCNMNSPVVGEHLFTFVPPFTSPLQRFSKYSLLSFCTHKSKSKHMGNRFGIWLNDGSVLQESVFLLLWDVENLLKIK